MERSIRVITVSAGWLFVCLSFSWSFCGGVLKEEEETEDFQNAECLGKATLHPRGHLHVAMLFFGILDDPAKLIPPSPSSIPSKNHRIGIWAFLKTVDLTKEQNVTVPYSVF